LHHLHSKTSSVAGSEQIKHSSSFDFFPSLLAGELAGRLELNASLAMSIGGLGLKLEG